MKLFNTMTPGRFRFSCLFAVLVYGCFFVSPLMAIQKTVPQLNSDNHRQAIEAWRASRHEGLERPNGWLTLVGLEWLNEGENRVGSAADNDIQLTGGAAYWGSVFLENDHLRFISSSDESVKINGEPQAEAVLIPDSKGKPTLVSSETLSFYVIFRGSYGLRVKDSLAKALLNFKDVENYAINESWRIDGRFTEAEEGTVIEITNVLGQVSDSPVFGTFEFDMNGKTHSLLGLGSAKSESLWFIFADRTSGRDTYGAGRFLYSDGMPENGRLTVDFNKAYNPPCAFNPYSTCPLPPQRNRMDIMVTAGEKDFHPDAG
jgi:uncharacterized protein (DUF1684 family)